MKQNIAILNLELDQKKKTTFKWRTSTLRPAAYFQHHKAIYCHLCRLSSVLPAIAQVKY